MPSMAKIRWKYVAGGEHLLRNCFARPGKTGKEELREAGAEEDERRRLGMLEPGAGCLAHEARRQDEQRCERKQLQRLAERGKAVEARQHDKVQRKRRQVDRQMRDAATENARERTVGLCHGDDRQH